MFSRLPVLPAFGALLLASAVLAPASAQESAASAFTPAQRAQIVAIVRQALKDDPSILEDAIDSIRRKAEDDRAATALSALHGRLGEIQAAPAYAVRGNPQGRVTVVEFYDPRCPYCRAMVGEVDRFLSRHPDARLVEKIVPVLGAGSTLDSRAIIAAGAQGKYDVMRRALMADTAPPSRERVAEIARANGLDTAKLQTDMDSPATSALIETNLAQAKAIGLDGTPTFIFGDAAVVPGAINAAQMDAFLAKAGKS